MQTIQILTADDEQQNTIKFSTLKAFPKDEDPGIFVSSYLSVTHYSNIQF
jgi:hypothetical protein